MFRNYWKIAIRQPGKQIAVGGVWKQYYPEQSLPTGLMAE
jgi:hypothetical protein